MELKSPPPVLRERETDALERSDDVLRLCELKRPPDECPLEVEVLWLRTGDTLRLRENMLPLRPVGLAGWGSGWEDLKRGMLIFEVGGSVERSSEAR